MDIEIINWNTEVKNMIKMEIFRFLIHTFDILTLNDTAIGIPISSKNYITYIVG